MGVHPNPTKPATPRIAGQGFLGIHALGQEFIDLFLQMEVKLVAEIQLRLVFAEKRA
jgi:hypothetical protein